MNKLFSFALLVAGLFWLVNADDSHGQFPRRKPGQKPGNNGGMVKVDVEVSPAENVPVRIMELKEEFDAKGRLKVLTPAEALKAKGETAAEQKLPGYKSYYTDLKRGDVVQVNLANPPKKGSTALTPNGQMQGTIRAVAVNTFTVQVEMPAAQAQGKDKITLPADQRLASMIVIQQRGADNMPDRPRRNKQ